MSPLLTGSEADAFGGPIFPSSFLQPSWLRNPKTLGTKRVKKVWGVPGVCQAEVVSGGPHRSPALRVPVCWLPGCDVRMDRRTGGTWHQHYRPRFSTEYTEM